MGGDFMDLIWILIIGLIAGWLGSLLMRGRGLGVVGDIIVGLIGALIGGYLLGFLGIGTTGTVSRLISAVIGAVILLAIISFIRRETVEG